MPIPFALFYSLHALAAVSAATFTVTSTAPDNMFAKVKKPAGTPPAIHGSYARGCIEGAGALSLQHEGYTVMRPSRNRFYGHPALLALIERAAAGAPKETHLLLGDLSQPAGGPMPYGHAAHQIGLDVDVWLTPEGLRQKTKVTEEAREKVEMQTVLDGTRKQLDPKRWHAKFADQILWFASQPEVDRIFVHAAIKKKLCETHRTHPALKKVRPWYFHDSHFHVRIRCPAGQTACESQAPVNEVGCDASIDH